MNRREKYSLPVVFTLTIAFIISGCKKLVEVAPPSNSINSGNVYAGDATAIAAVTEMYASISSADIPGGGIASLNLFPSLSADELSLYLGAGSSAVTYYYQNSLSPVNLSQYDFWSSFYRTIYTANAAIKGITASTGLTPSVKQQLVGEVKFIRAFCYFYLVNLYGDVPLILTTDYKANATPGRTGKDKVYEQILLDLKDAQNILSSNFLDATLSKVTVERVRPTKWAATALLARVYLFRSDFANVEIESSKIINSGMFSLPGLNDVFKMNSAEAIWQLQPVNGGWNTEDAKTFILPSNGPDAYNHRFYLSNQLSSSFEGNDQRKLVWTSTVTVGANTYSYAYKYKSATYNAPITEYEMVFRLAEQYLIRAEAEAQLGKFIESRNDIYRIRQRAGLTNTTATDKASLLSAILHERQVEMFTEWGHRWFDLKRTGTIDAVMSVVTPQKGGTWNSDWQWYPISKSEMILNPNLVQNNGY